MKKEMRAILIGAGGGFSSEEDRKKGLSVFRKKIQLRPGDLRIGVDGGVDAWFQMGLSPDLAVGDWDSFRGKKEALKSIPHVTLPTEKDRSDLFFGLVAALQAGAREIICFGVTGGRPDHHLAALSDLSEFSTGRRGRVKAIQAFGEEAEYHFLSTVIPVWERDLPQGTLISLFAMGGAAKGVSASGFKYPLPDVILPPSSLGLSNRTSKRKCRVRLRNGQLLLIIPQ